MIFGRFSVDFGEDVLYTLSIFFVEIMAETLAKIQHKNQAPTLGNHTRRANNLRVRRSRACVLNPPHLPLASSDSVSNHRSKNVLNCLKLALISPRGPRETAAPQILSPVPRSFLVHLPFFIPLATLLHPCGAPLAPFCLLLVSPWLYFT